MGQLWKMLLDMLPQEIAILDFVFFQEIPFPAKVWNFAGL